MRKKDLEKLELDIAREKDREVAERLKAVLESLQREWQELKDRRRRTGRFVADWLLGSLVVLLMGFLALVGIVSVIGFLIVEPESDRIPFAIIGSVSLILLASLWWAVRRGGRARKGG